MFIVLKSEGEFDDYQQNNIFITDNEEFAKKYVEKANNLLQRLKKHYSKYDNSNCWIKKKYISKFESWYKIRNMNKFWYEKIELRH